MADGASTDGRAQRRVPRLYVERPQLAYHLGTEMQRNLVLEQLSIPLRGARRDRAGGLALIDAIAHEVGHRCGAVTQRRALAAFSGWLVQVTALRVG